MPRGIDVQWYLRHKERWCFSFSERFFLAFSLVHSVCVRRCPGPWGPWWLGWSSCPCGAHSPEGQRDFYAPWPWVSFQSYLDLILLWRMGEAAENVTVWGCVFVTGVLDKRGGGISTYKGKEVRANVRCLSFIRPKPVTAHPTPVLLNSLFLLVDYYLPCSQS